MQEIISSYNTGMKKLKLNLGCGFDKRDGYLNLDVDPRVKPDKVHDLYKPLPFDDNSVNEIILQDIVEHFTKEDAIKLIQECARVLEKNGIIYIRVPNVKAILNEFTDKEDILMLFVYGDTSVSGVWGAHKYGYTEKIMTDLLYSHGLQVTSTKEVGTNWEFFAKKLVKNPKLTVTGENSDALLSDRVQEVLLKHAVPPYTYFVITSPLQLLKNSQKEHCVWFIRKPFSALISKLFIRKFLKKIEFLIVDDDSTETFARDVLRFSHLRILRL